LRAPQRSGLVPSHSNLEFGSESKHSKVAMAKDFTLDDFRRQLDQVEKMGMKDQLGRVAGLSSMVPDKEDRDLAFRRIRQMLDAMTDDERSNPDLITSSSLPRIAASSGTHPQEVEMFLAQFNQVRAVMRQMAGMSFWQRLKLIFGFGKFPGQEGEPS
jgi:signal recognition particle subunit SRP54